jgi:hypothetical protein
MIITAFILLILAVIINYFNNLKDARNGHINHTRSWKIKALTCIPSVVLFTLSLTSAPGFGWLTLLASGKSILLTGAWFMLLFNCLWGWKVYKDPFHRSTAVGKSLSWSDRKMLHWPKWLYVLFMVALVTGATLTYFL